MTNKQRWKPHSTIPARLAFTNSWRRRRGGSTPLAKAAMSAPHACATLNSSKVVSKEEEEEEEEEEEQEQKEETKQVPTHGPLIPTLAPYSSPPLWRNCILGS